MRKKKILVMDHDHVDWNGTKRRLNNYPRIKDAYEFKSIIGDINTCIEEVEKINLNEYSGILLDVFFYDNKETIIEQAPNDDSHILLNYLRKKAPWVPIIAYTQHLDNDLTYYVDKRGYDVIVPKELIKKSPDFHENLFDDIFESARKNRTERSICSDYLPEKNNLNNDNDIRCEIDDDTKKFFQNIDEHEFKRLIKSSFPLQDDIIITSMNSGLSGNRVFKVSTKRIDGNIDNVTYWILKSGIFCDQLLEEVKKVKEIKMNGFHHKFFPPLLNDGIIHEPPYCAIVYQMETDTESLYNFVYNFTKENQNKLETYIGKIADIISEMFKGYRKENGIIRNHIISKEKIEQLILKIKNKNIKITDYGININTFKQLIDKRIEYHRGFIHGDFHPENVLVDNNDEIFIIDFEKFKQSTVAMDIAKLESHFMYNRLPHVSINNRKKICLSSLGSDLIVGDNKLSCIIRAIRKIKNEQFDYINDDEWYWSLLVMSLKYAAYPKIDLTFSKLAAKRVGALIEIIKNK